MLGVKIVMPIFKIYTMSQMYDEVESKAKVKYNTVYSNIVNTLKGNPELAETAAEGLVNKCIDEITLDVVAEFHRDIKLGYGHYYYGGGDPEMGDGSNASEKTFDEETEKKAEDIKCPNCSRPIHASRFAPHLEKCMRMGRNSSRIASRRIANNSKENTYHAGTDDDDDDDWNASDKLKSGKKLEPKRKRDKPRKQKPIRTTKDSSELEEVTPNKLLNMTEEDKSEFWSKTCGVKIENSNKLCPKPLKCSQHTDEERALARKLSLPGSSQDPFIETDSTEKPEQDSSANDSGNTILRKRESKSTRTKKAFSSDTSLSSDM